MATEFYSYDPDNITLVIGPVPVDSWGPDGLVIARDGDHTTKVVGIKGDMTVNRNRDKTGTIAINVLTGSDIDKMFDELQAVDDLTNFPVVLKVDGINKQLVTTGWYETMPDLELAAEAGSRTHVIGLQNAIPSAIAAAFNLAGTVENAITQG
jgi:hypothetical protein